LAAQRLAIHAEGRWCTWMYETRPELGQISHYEAAGSLVTVRAFVG